MKIIVLVVSQQPLSMCGVDILREGNFDISVKGSHFVLIRFLDVDLITVGAVEDGTIPFPTFYRNCAVTAPENWIRSLFGGHVWLATLNSCMFLSSLDGKTFVILSNFRWLKHVSENCCLTIWRIDGIFEQLVVCSLSSAVPEWTRDIFNLNFWPLPGYFQ